MLRTRHILIGTVSALALAALPVNLASLASGSLEPASAFAKNGGNGGGGSNRGGGGQGEGHGGGGSHGKSGGDHGKSASARGQSGGSKAGGSSHRPSKTTVTDDRGSGHKGKGRKSTDTTLAKASKSPKKNTLDVEEVEVSGLPETAPLPPAEDENLNARLAGLHSLNRNYRAYLNSQDPRMAAIRDYVTAYSDLEQNFDKSFPTSELAALYTETDDPKTLSELQDRLNELSDQTAPLTQDEADEKEALEAFLDGATDEALKDALLDAANENRVAQYGEEDYVNEDVMDWAKGVLGVGEAVGKIDEVRDSLENDAP